MKKGGCAQGLKGGKTKFGNGERCQMVLAMGRHMFWQPLKVQGVKAGNMGTRVSSKRGGGEGSGALEQPCLK